MTRFDRICELYEAQLILVLSVVALHVIAMFT